MRGEKKKTRRGDQEEDWRSAGGDEAKSTGEEEEGTKGEVTLKTQSGIELGCSLLCNAVKAPLNYKKVISDPLSVLPSQATKCSSLSVI